MVKNTKSKIQKDRWAAHADGFVHGNIGVFPAIGGAWVVWECVDGEWSAVEPRIFEDRSGRSYDKDRTPPYEFWERTREDTIRAAMKVALDYQAKQ